MKAITSVVSAALNEPAGNAAESFKPAVAGVASTATERVRDWRGVGGAGGTVTGLSTSSEETTSVVEAAASSRARTARNVQAAKSLPRPMAMFAPG